MSRCLGYRSASGRLLHDLMAAVADLYSRNLADEVKRGIRHKVERGGTPFRAPLGYCNVRVKQLGRWVQTVAVNEERAPLVRSAFQRCGRGTVSMAELCKHLQKQGLKTVPSARNPVAQPITMAQLRRMLRNPYYTGVVAFDGKRYVGRHEAIVKSEEFGRVQRRLDGKKKQVDDKATKADSESVTA